MRKVWPHEFFRLDFDQMLEDGKRQEQIHSANKGEYILVQRMHSYFINDVIPQIIHNDWGFEAATEFAVNYANEYFQHLRLDGQETYNAQKSLSQLNDKIIDFLARSHLAGFAPRALDVELTKGSDFYNLLDLENAQPELRRQAEQLYEDAKDHEMQQLTITLRTIRSNYEVTLPRIMYVVRRAIKVGKGLSKKSSDNELKGISEYIDWYTTHIDNQHALYPVLGQLRDFYKVARNVGSHHKGFSWQPEDNTVILEDDNLTLKIHVHEFQQRYRHLTYLCELGVRGILSAFCERERGSISKQLVKQYIKTFPEGFPAGEQGIVNFYPT